MEKIYKLLEKFRLEGFYKRFLDFGIKQEQDFIDSVNDKTLKDLGKSFIKYTSWYVRIQDCVITTWFIKDKHKPQFPRVYLTCFSKNEHLLISFCWLFFSSKVFHRPRWLGIKTWSHTCRELAVHKCQRCNKCLWWNRLMHFIYSTDFQNVLRGKRSQVKAFKPHKQCRITVPHCTVKS